MSKRDVVVEGGGSNLYEVSEYAGEFYVYKVSVGLFSDDRTSIGTCNKLEDALTLVRMHSGRNIKSIKVR